MTQARRFTGGCLCGALRYEADGEPGYQGVCCCTDCRRASGSGFIPFIGMAASAVRFAGETRIHAWDVGDGRQAVRNYCPACGSLVFGGVVGIDDSHTLYAGSLDDPSLFRPTIAIFNRSRPDWVVLPEGLAVFEALPPRDGDGEGPDSPA